MLPSNYAVVQSIESKKEDSSEDDHDMDSDYEPMQATKTSFKFIEKTPLIKPKIFGEDKKFNKAQSIML